MLTNSLNIPFNFLSELVLLLSGIGIATGSLLLNLAGIWGGGGGGRFLIIYGPVSKITLGFISISDDSLPSASLFKAYPIDFFLIEETALVLIWLHFLISLSKDSNLLLLFLGTVFMISCLFSIDMV